MFYLKGFASLVLTLYEYFIDFILLCRFSKASPFQFYSSSRINYDLIILAHTVEKGLSVKKVRYGFGKTKIKQIFKLIDLCKSININYLPSFSMVQDSFLQYLELHDHGNYDLGHFGLAIREYIQALSSGNSIKLGGGAVEACSRNYHNDFDSQVKNFLVDRHSSRIYSSEIVAVDVMQEVFRLLVNSPSQCNRQSSFVHVFHDYHQIQSLLLLQGGSATFKEGVRNLAIITNDLSSWSGHKARHQLYVDGSLFSMYFMLALNACGLKCCSLNLAVTNNLENKIKRQAEISLNQRLIMMVSFGYPSIEHEKEVIPLSCKHLVANRCIIH